MKTQHDLLVPVTDTPFWIADKVKIAKSSLYSSLGREVEPPRTEEKELVLLVAPFQYDTINAKRSDNHNIPQYRIGGTRLSPPLYSIFRIDYNYYAYEKDMKLVERGPLWQFFHGGWFEFSFMGESEKVLGFLGNFKRIENPQHGKRAPYVWSLREALEAIKTGFGDIILGRPEGLDIKAKKPPLVFVGKFDDKDLGHLFAEVTLKRHGLS